MKRIYLMRHSKAGQTNKKLTHDIERALTKKGEDQAKKLGEVLNKLYAKDFPPKLIITSNAIRAKQTASLLKSNFKQNKNLESEVHAELYLDSETEIINILKQVDDKIDSVLIVSHIPGLQNFAVDFAHSGDKVKFRQMRSNFPPGSFAVFDVDIDKWKNIEPQKGDLVNFINSKKLKEYL